MKHPVGVRNSLWFEKQPLVGKAASGCVHKIAIDWDYDCL